MRNLRSSNTIFTLIGMALGCGFAPRKTTHGTISLAHALCKAREYSASLKNGNGIDPFLKQSTQSTIGAHSDKWSAKHFSTVYRIWVLSKSVPVYRAGEDASAHLPLYHVSRAEAQQRLKRYGYQILPIGIQMPPLRMEQKEWYEMRSASFLDAWHKRPSAGFMVWQMRKQNG